jgi:hypothetical protein
VTKSGADVSITMRKETLLVIFEFLSKSYEQWSASGGSHGSLQSDETFVLKKLDAAERIALWALEGEIERTLPEVFWPDYAEIVATEKQRLTAAAYGHRKLT